MGRCNKCRAQEQCKNVFHVQQNWSVPEDAFKCQSAVWGYQVFMDPMTAAATRPTISRRLYATMITLTLTNVLIHER